MIARTVYVDIDEFTDQELIDEMNFRNLTDFNDGYTVDSCSDEQLKQEIEGRGYHVVDIITDPTEKIYNLYYDVCDGKNTKTLLRNFFLATIDKTL